MESRLFLREFHQRLKKWYYSCISIQGEEELSQIKTDTAFGRLIPLNHTINRKTGDLKQRYYVM